ncbi:Na+/H+ antiporter NhaA [Marinactinospora thermotolerans]|uniref:Na(+)/H(+) antiporter NhaA n=1 Tax=Marinactinospora thermotolerans DSM 45154 TaxID=1122192 RepID=A0A1T4RQL9_9ACTN|nr:Na+/H+ antiporter NhaA [Marinactinospora thermotolerans]SKA18187.1 sodium/proton antiporter, NhaA family [Marinactinospora thermotolerans DSM 45154]
MTRTDGTNRLASWLRKDVVSGSILIAGAVIALIWANSPLEPAYEAIRTFSFGPESLHLHLSVEAWAADGLLAIFFFIVGNELKQEFVNGELRNPRRAMLPIIAALCGMVVPALIYAVINMSRGAEALHGWGIPMATDIAFAVAILAVIGRYLPPALRTFLLTLAIVDDLGAIIVIAIFYTADLAFLPLFGAFALLAVFGYLQRGRGIAAALDRSALPNWVVYVPLAFAIWALMHASGVHATIAGVAMGMLMRTRKLPGEEHDPSHRAEHLLRPWSSAIALPIFSLMSAGVVFDGLGSLFTDTVALGVIAGLVGGKFVGIFGGSWITTKITSAELNPSLKWIDIAGMSLLAGIGFTVSLLISELSFAANPVELAHAKGGVLIASLIATVLAAAVLGSRSRHYRKLGLAPVRTDTAGGSID